MQVTNLEAVGSPGHSNQSYCPHNSSPQLDCCVESDIVSQEETVSITFYKDWRQNCVGATTHKGEIFFLFI